MLVFRRNTHNESSLDPCARHGQYVLITFRNLYPFAFEMSSLRFLAFAFVTAAELV